MDSTIETRFLTYDVLTGIFFDVQNKLCLISKYLHS